LHAYDISPGGRDKLKGRGGEWWITLNAGKLNTRRLSKGIEQYDPHRQTIAHAQIKMHKPGITVTRFSP
jgi:hypothetical protein